MAQQDGPDLRTLLEDDRVAVLDFIDSARKLVVEVRASHYWTEQGIQHLKQIEHIGANLGKLMEELNPHWGEGKRIFNRAEAAKLWKTAAGLMAALQPIRVKFAEQIDKRRRQRIMGQTYEEVAELTEEELEQSLVEFVELSVSARNAFEALDFSTIPQQLSPIMKVDKPSANGQKVEVKDGDRAEDIASEAKEPAGQPDEQAG